MLETKTSWLKDSIVIKYEHIPYDVLARLHTLMESDDVCSVADVLHRADAGDGFQTGRVRFAAIVAATLTIDGYAVEVRVFWEIAKYKNQDGLTRADRDGFALCPASVIQAINNTIGVFPVA